MFTFYYNQNGARRKQFVKAISGILEARPRYTGMPRCAYEIDFVTVTKEGNIEVDERSDTEEVEELIEKLAMLGFTPEAAEGMESESVEQPVEEDHAAAEDHPAEEEHHLDQPQASEQSLRDEAGRPNEEEPTVGEPARDVAMTISVPRSSLTDIGLENLRRLVYAKEDLIRRAFDIDSTEIEVTDEAVSFPWFGELTPEELKHASQFISGMCQFANTKKRITCKRKNEENPKFAMRVWAIRMGFGGNEHKALRKYLMRRLPGDAAFRYGRPNENGTTESAPLPVAQ